jgi:arsenite methyltransferase
MEPQIIERTDRLELYLKQIGKIFNISQIVNEPQEKPQIIDYYLMNKLTYRLFYNWEGFFHSGISYDGKRKKGDVKEQARTNDRYIHDMNATNVLELGYGLGVDSGFLARRNPQVTFDALDISNKPLKRFTKIPNLHFYFGDFHDLSRFQDNFYDIVFVIEALCYSTNKRQVLREVKKKLKSGGIFVIFDVYRNDRASPLSDSENTMWELMTKGLAADKFECVREVEEYMREDFSIIATTDLSPCILPSFDRQESLVRPYFKHPAFAKAINRFVPFGIVKNAIVVFLIPTSVRRQIACYYLHVLQKDQ